MEEVQKDVLEIPIPPKARENILQLYSAMKELETRLGLVMGTLIEAAGGKGNYVPSQDMTKLVPAPESK